MNPSRVAKRHLVVGQLSLHRLEQGLSITIFFFLFAGDFVSFYVRNVVGVWMPPFGVLAYGLAASLLLLKSVRLGRTISISQGVSIGFLGAFLGWTVFAVVASGRGDFADYYLIARYVLYFFMGVQVYAVLDSRALRTGALLAYIGIVSLVVVNIDSSYRLYFAESPVNYIRLAESFVFLSLVLMSSLRARYSQMIVYLISLVVLFFVNSRAALFGFAFAGLLLFLLRTDLPRFFASMSVLVFVMLLLLPVAFTLMSLGGDEGALLETRVFRLLLTPEEDTSLRARKALLEAGWESIKQNWFLGDFKGQTAYGGYGSYIHNGLSFWRQYGFIPFSLLVFWVIFILTVYLAQRSKLLGAGVSVPYKLSFVTFLYVVLLVMSARSFVYLELFFALGMSTAAFSRNARDAHMGLRYGDVCLRRGVKWGGALGVTKLSWR